MRIMDSYVGSLTRQAWSALDDRLEDSAGDCTMVQIALRNVLGLYLSREHCHTLWAAYSTERSTPWATPPDTDDDIVRCLTMDV